jgi:hypothetical protein
VACLHSAWLWTLGGSSNCCWHEARHILGAFLAWRVIMKEQLQC